MTIPSYLALAGEPGALGALLDALRPSPGEAPRLNRVFETPELVVFASPETPLVRLEEERGLLIGRAFRGFSAVERVQAFSLSESRHAAWSGGRSLLEGKWGGFVALTLGDGGIAVLRDPSGAVPAYSLDWRGVRLFSSEYRLTRVLEQAAPELDDAFLRQWLTYPALRTARTGIVGWSELMPATLRRFRPGNVSSVETAWTPWRAATGERRIDNIEEAARRVREVALATIAIQLDGIQRPVLELSGGLDSAIVAACLRQGNIAFDAVNFATASPDGDERDYARLVAEHLGIVLAERREDSLPLDLRPPPRGMSRPQLSPVLQPLQRGLSAHARAVDSSDFVTGAGGDNLFGYITTAAPVLDALADHGLRAAWSTLHDVAAMGECTLWKAGRYTARKHLRRAKRSPWRRETRFLSPDAIASEPDAHPWLARPPDPRPGKIEHVEALVLIHHFLEPRYSSGEALHHPLLNQPLMELCLAIPTWLWIQGGVNRAVARAAFADLLPEEVLRRRSKGSLESMSVRAFSANRARIAELLLGGELDRRGLIARADLEARLHGDARQLGDAHFRIFDLVSMELWLRSWRG